jgi:hypothetical protein
VARDFKIQTVNPECPTGPPVDVTLPGDLIERYYKWMPVRYENLRAAKEVLDRPARIFYGVREYNEGGWCYTGRPQTWFVRERVQAPFLPKHVFAVYVNPMMKVYECRAEPADKGDPESPVNWRERYRGLVWKSTS